MSGDTVQYLVKLVEMLAHYELTTDVLLLQTFNVNTMGCVRTTMAFLPLLKKGKGRIVNMSSVNGRVATPLNLPYCVSKFGIEAFSDGLR